MEVMGPQLKLWYLFMKLQGITSHKVIIQTSAGMRTSNYAI